MASGPRRPRDVFGQLQVPIRKRGSSKCASHKHREVMYVCNDCKELICSKCCISTHKTHDLVEFTDIVKQKAAILQDFINNTEQDKLPKLLEDLKFTEEKMISNGEHFQEIVTRVKEQGEKCKNEIDRRIAELISACTEMENQNRDILQKLRAEQQQKYEEFTQKIRESKEALQEGNTAKVYDVADDIQPNDINLTAPLLRTLEFCPCTSITTNVRQTIGNMVTSDDNWETKKTNSQGTLEEIIETCHTNQGHVRFLDKAVVQSQFRYSNAFTSFCPVPDGGAWLCDQNSCIITLIDNDGKTKRELTHQCCVQDISLTPNTNRLWFCCFLEKSVNEVSPSFQTSSIRFKTEKEPGCLSITREGNVVVGTDCRVAVHTQDGTVLHTTADYGKGILLTWRIAQCSKTDNIAVAIIKTFGDNGNDWRGYLTVYDDTLNTKCVYQGEDIKEKSKEVFFPYSVAYDSKGNIVIGDSKRRAIEVISGGGRHLKRVHTNKGKLSCIGIQANDLLWIRSESENEDKEIKLLKYYMD